ncbi:MAG: hypothetical protein J1E62_00915 [Lachnospiraceae bacterium]|nr:hypothetical protein [Lachnospiraceae bacterium]
MRQYETAIRIAQVHHLADERKYKKALAVIETLDMRQVRNVSDLKVFAEVYTRTEQFEAAKATYLRIYKKSRTRRILYRLIYLAIRTNELDEAESFYREFLKMNPNNRDSLILRYRIDKASGAPIGQLIDILKTLKDEEYIEEWAYELAKLYQQAGRYVECREECEDIKLWFGQGEIVERAKLLLEHIDEKNPLPFMDDKDFTEKKEEPNPEDTGSLPDINEYLQRDNEHEMKLLKKVDPAKFEETMEDYVPEKSSEKGMASDDEPIPDEIPVAEDVLAVNVVDAVTPENNQPLQTTDEFEDDYDERLLENDDAALPKMAMDGIQKLSGLLFGGKKEDGEDENSEQTSSGQDGLVFVESSDGQTKDKNAYSQINPDDYPRISQSGTGITQDLAAEISAIFEAEQSEQLKEKAVTVFNELPNKTNEVVERLTEEAAKTPTKEYIPMEARRGREMPMDDDMAKTMVIPTLDVPESTQAENTMVVQPNMPDAGNQPVAPQNPAEGQPGASGELSAEALLMEALEAEVQAVEAQAAVPSDQAVANQASELQAAMQAQTVANQPAQQGAAVPNQASALQAAMQAQAAANQPAQQGAAMSNQSVPPQQEVSAEVASEQMTAAVEEAAQPDPMITESATGEILLDKDLPTTRALHRSFADILILIGGELDPSHFVLMGDGDERILGISKKIATVMRETGYLSTGRIARIDAEQLNQMDLVQFKSQLKGNCLLVTRAADLLFPAITKIFSIMDEYYGDFAVILSDEGATLDQLFRFVPALARRFKYIIDISQYTEQDYR